MLEVSNIYIYVLILRARASAKYIFEHILSVEKMALCSTYVVFKKVGNCETCLDRRLGARLIGECVLVEY